MPELPEVETTVKSLSGLVVGSKIVDFWTDVPQRHSNIQNISFLKREILSVKRIGKNIVFVLSGGISILVHQKISGHLLYGTWSWDGSNWITEDNFLSERINSFIRFVFVLDNKSMIVLVDPRKFAKVEVWENSELDKKINKSIAPDALSVSKKEFIEILSKRRGIIKRVLMDQSIISGIGNIYSDEILWDAKISPYSIAKDVDALKLYNSTRKILLKAIKLKGDSMSDYRLVDGSKGSFQKEHRVYGREGLKCLRNDGGIIQIKKIGNRSLRFCPVCQK